MAEQDRLFPEQQGEFYGPDVSLIAADDGPLLPGSQAVAGFRHESVSGEIFGAHPGRDYQTSYEVVIHGVSSEVVAVDEETVAEIREYPDSDDLYKHLSRLAMHAIKVITN